MFTYAGVNCLCCFGPLLVHGTVMKMNVIHHRLFIVLTLLKQKTYAEKKEKVKAPAFFFLQRPPEKSIWNDIAAKLDYNKTRWSEIARSVSSVIGEFGVRSDRSV